MTKKVYRVRNWSHYNKSLINRGSITFWISEEVIKEWVSPAKPISRGRPQAYPDSLILAALSLRQLYHLTLRATEGFLQSLSQLMKLFCKAPTYTTLCKRSKTVRVPLEVSHQSAPRHVLVDSTGIQVVGEGEWKTLVHGRSKHQVWRKLHIAMDADNHCILAMKMTESVRHDGNQLPDLIDQIKGNICQITGDGAYDKKSCYHAAYQRGAKPVFPPQHDACVQRNKINKDPALIARDKTIEEIGRGEGREERLKEWKKKTNYHRRSRIETLMSRMKSVFGDQMRARCMANQQTDLAVRCQIINKMNCLGMPISVVVDKVD